VREPGALDAGVRGLGIRTSGMPGFGVWSAVARCAGGRGDDVVVIGNTAVRSVGPIGEGGVSATGRSTADDRVGRGATTS